MKILIVEHFSELDDPQLVEREVFPSTSIIELRS